MNEQVMTISPPLFMGETSEFDLTNLITEDDEPVDNIPSSKQQRIFVEPLYSSSKLRRPFLADSNIAIYATPRANPIVPDMFLSMDVQVADDWWQKQNRSYLMWEFNKPPEVVIEIVSNNKGKEGEEKLHDYAELGVLYYVIYDPQEILTDDIIRVYQLVAGEYLLRPDYRLAEVGLSLNLWYGEFEGKTQLWLRWFELPGNLIPTGAERAQQEQQRAERERQRAEQAEAHAQQEAQRAQQAEADVQQARQRAEQAEADAQTERKKVERLMAQLRALGVEPNPPTS